MAKKKAQKKTAAGTRCSSSASSSQSQGRTWTRSASYAGGLASYDQGPVTTPRWKNPAASRVHTSDPSATAANRARRRAVRSS